MLKAIRSNSGSLKSGSIESKLSGSPLKHSISPKQSNYANSPGNRSKKSMKSDESKIPKWK